MDFKQSLAKLFFTDEIQSLRGEKIYPSWICIRFFLKSKVQKRNPASNRYAPPPPTPHLARIEEMLVGTLTALSTPLMRALLRATWLGVRITFGSDSSRKPSMMEPRRHVTWSRKEIYFLDVFGHFKTLRVRFSECSGPGYIFFLNLDQFSKCTNGMWVGTEPT